MFASLQSYATSMGIGTEALMVFGVGLGVLLAILGVTSSLGGKDPVLRRLSEQGSRRTDRSQDNGLLRPAETTPSGIMKTFVPSDEKTRTAVQRQLSAAGMTGQHALRNFYLLRVVMGVVLPALLAGIIMTARIGFFPLPEPVEAAFSGLSQLHLMVILGLMIAAGFFGPVIWLRGRAEERRRAIAEAFPNALDLIQISAEAGLGFDAAMIRVGNELARSAPALSHELLIAQREIQAGRNRDRALLDMAARTGLDEVTSFVNVVLQSIQFGTSISGTLSAYAREMRQNRELRAQEMANKLPVKMSAIMASLMLPALLLLTLGPVVIRYTRYFAG
jgi:tight adherence protein C